MRTLSALLVLVFLLAFLTAGCADSSPPDEADSPMADDPPAQSDAFVTGQGTFGWVAAAGVPTTGIDTQVGSSNAMTIDVPEGATSLTVTATWTCANPVCSLHYYLGMPSPASFPPTPAMLMRDGAHAMGPSPLTLTVENPEAGTWWASVHADALAAQAAGTFTYELMVSAEAEPASPATEKP